MTIHAYTDLTSPLPAYINISERVSDSRDAIVTVRSSGENSSSTIILSRDELRKLADAIYKHTHPAPEPVSVPDDVVKDAARWRFSMKWQMRKEPPQAIIDMWRKVYEDERLNPTVEEYEEAIDAALAAERGWVK